MLRGGSLRADLVAASKVFFFFFSYSDKISPSLLIQCELPSFHLYLYL